MSEWILLLQLFSAMLVGCSIILIAIGGITVHRVIPLVVNIGLILFYQFYLLPMVTA